MLRIIYIIITGLFSLIAILVKLRKTAYDPNASREERYQVARRLCRYIISHGKMDPLITGLENLPDENGYLIAPNHQGLIDCVLICDNHDKPLTAVGKLELGNIIVIKDIAALLQARLMDRNNLRQSMKIIKEVTEDLKQGITYIIFPEGTRSKQGNVMGEFKGGTFKSAMNAKAPIVPCCLIDCFKVLDSKGLARVQPQVHFLKAIYYEEYQNLSGNEIALMVQSRIQEKMDECLGK